jgi:hypothetical protein
MPVLQVLRLRAVLQVLLEGVSPVRGADRREGRLVNNDGVLGLLGCHGGWLSVTVVWRIKVVHSWYLEGERKSQ